VATPATASAATAWFCLRPESPNPARPRADISYRGSPDDPVRIYASSGRHVKNLVPQSDGEGLRVVWDGRDESGTLVPEATYFIQLGTEITSVARLELVR
jgi:hypothetical protein